MSCRPALTVAVCLALALVPACGTSTKPAGSAAPSNPDLARYAWVVGDAGTILATTDGGAHWVHQVSGTQCELDAVAFADPLHGWAVGNPMPPATGGSVILATTDGGHTWSTQSTLEAGFLFDVTCAGPTNVWVAGHDPHGGFLLASADGGASWTNQLSGDLGYVLRVAFVDTRHGFASTFDGVGGSAAVGHLLQTSDGGADWEVGISQPVAMDGLAPAGTSVCWTTGLTAGSNPPDPVRLSFGDAKSLTPKTPPAGPDKLEGVVVYGSRVAIFGPVSEAGGKLDARFWSSTDAGVTWSLGSSLLDMEPQSVAFSDAERGWAAGGRWILSTRNAGKTWTRSLRLDGKRVLRDIACLFTGTGSVK